MQRFLNFGKLFRLIAEFVCYQEKIAPINIRQLSHKGFTAAKWEPAPIGPPSAHSLCCSDSIDRRFLALPLTAQRIEQARGRSRCFRSANGLVIKILWVIGLGEKQPAFREQTDKLNAEGNPEHLLVRPISIHQ